jgi:hypothetical protein
MKQIRYAPRTPDELDVTAIFQKAIYFFTHYGKLLLIVALGGMLAGLLRFWFTPNLYSSSLVLQPTMLSDPEQLEIINNWSALLKKDELPVLAHQFNVDKSLIKKVIWIKTEELQKSHAPNNFTAFTVTVLVNDTTVLPALQKGILYALDNSEYVKDKLLYRKKTLQSLIQTIQQEINRLYNMQSTIEANLQSGINNNGRYIIDVSGISSQIAALQEKKLAFEENLSFVEAVHVLQNFYTPDRPTYPQLWKQLAIGLAGGMMLGGAIALYLQIRKRIKSQL